MRILCILAAVFIVSGAAGPGGAVPIVLDVPAYNQGPNPWCTVVAMASIFGYWDMNGYPDLFAADETDIYQTASVWPEVLEMVAGPYQEVAGTAMHFAESKGYEFTVTEYFYQYEFDYSSRTVWEEGKRPQYGTATWLYDYAADTPPFTFDLITDQIDAGRPLWYGSNPNDPDFGYHAMPVIGYDSREDGGWLAYYTNWYEDEYVLWKPFNPDWMSGLIMMEPISRVGAFACTTSVPEPGTLFLLGLGLVGLSGLGRKFKR